MSRVSVIMPAFNAAATMARSIASVQAQSISDWQLLIVDDCSRDATAAIAAAAAANDHRITVLRAERNGGVARARNLGIEAATGGHVAFLDADDEWMPDKLEHQFAAAPPRFSCMGYCHVDAAGRPGRTLLPPDTLDYRTFQRGSQIGTLTVAIDRAWLGGRRFPLRGHEDFALWLDLLRDGSVAQRVGAPRAYARYRVGNGSLSANKLRAIGWMWSIWRDQERCGPLHAAQYTAAHALRGLAKHYL